MEIVIAAVVLAAGLVAGASLLSRRTPALAGTRSERQAARRPRPAEPAASGGRTDADLKERRTEMVRLEERLLSKEAALDQQRTALDHPRGGARGAPGRDRASCASTTCASSSASPG